MNHVQFMKGGILGNFWELNLRQFRCPESNFQKILKTLNVKVLRKGVIKRLKTLTQ